MCPVTLLVHTSSVEVERPKLIRVIQHQGFLVYVLEFAVQGSWGCIMNKGVIITLFKDDGF